MRRFTILVVLAAGACTESVKLDDIFSGSRAQWYELTEQRYDRRARRVSATLTFFESQPMADVEAPPLRVVTWDVAGRRFVHHPTGLAGKADRAARTVTWTLKSWRVPKGHRYAGVAVNGGRYRRGHPPTTSTFVKTIASGIVDPTVAER